jgi:DNA end-binding protein Ku
MRPIWKGYLKLSLVTVPVKVYSATSSHSLSFNQLHATCNSRINYTKTCPVHGAIPNEEIVRGYAYEKDRYVIMGDQDFEKVRLESTKAISIVRFVESSEIDPIFYGSAYYLEPDGKMAREAYATLSEAMAGKVAIAKVVLRGKEDLVAVRVAGGVLVMSALYYADEVRGTAELEELKDVPAPEAEAIQLARQLISGLAGPFEPAIYKDEYQEQLLAIIEEKVQGREAVVADEGAEPLRVVNLMEALKKSLASGAGAPSRAKAAPAREVPAASAEPVRKQANE